MKNQDIFNLECGKTESPQSVFHFVPKTFVKRIRACQYRWIRTILCTYELVKALQFGIFFEFGIS